MNKYPDLKLTKVLAVLIRDKGLTITSLSRLTQVPLQTLHGWLQGNEPKSIRQVKKVADFFKVSLDHLCFGIEKKEEKELTLKKCKSVILEVTIKEIT